MLEIQTLLATSNQSESTVQLILKKYKRLSQSYREDQIIYIYDRTQYLEAKVYALNLLNDIKRNYSGSHKEPLAWLTGHFMNYIMQYSDQFKAMAY